jgi:carbon-monoxide dehydrogenase small subunit
LSSLRDHDPDWFHPRSSPKIRGFVSSKHDKLAASVMNKELISLRVNGREHQLASEPNQLLLDVLRRDLGLTGSKRACDDSSCGACTVLIDGVPMLSCTLLAASCQGSEITTVESVAEDGRLSALQHAWGQGGGSQCGYCTPGFMMTVKVLLENNPEPTDDEIKRAISGNLCRCTGYTQMFEAVKLALRTQAKAAVAE